MNSQTLLRENNLRRTAFRMAVLDVFLATPNALSTEDIEASLGKFDRVTLYRTLKTFKDKGVLHEIAYPNDQRMLALSEKKCASDDHPHNHVHFRCTVCKTIRCIDVAEIPTLNLKDFELHQIEIQARGICPACK